MQIPQIDIDSLPLLDTAVGLFGTVAQNSGVSMPSMMEVILTILMIIYD